MTSNANEVYNYNNYRGTDVHSMCMSDIMISRVLVINLLLHFAGNHYKIMMVFPPLDYIYTTI